MNAQQILTGAKNPTRIDCPLILVGQGSGTTIRRLEALQCNELTGVTGTFSPVTSSVTAIGVAMNPQRDAIVMGVGSFPYVRAVPWSDTTGIGALYSNPGGGITGGAGGISFSPDGTVVVVTGYGMPNIAAYSWSTATGFGTIYSNPVTIPDSSGNKVRFSRTGKAIGVATVGTPYFHFYPWDNSTGFGTKMSSPSITEASYGNSIEFSYDNKYVAMGYTGYPYLRVFGWDDTAGFSGTGEVPAVPSAGAADIKFSPSNDAIAVTHYASPCVTAWAFDSSAGTFGTKYSAPTTAFADSTAALCFSPNGKLLCVAADSSPYYRLYPWSSYSGFGAEFNTTSYPVTGPKYDVTFSGVVQ